MNIVLKKYSSKFIPILLIALGVLQEMRAYIANRPLWGDETSLITDILSSSFAGLTKPLGNYQAAPIGFLFLQKIILIILGNRDYIFKIVPLTAGIASIFLMYEVARRYLEIQPAFLFALGLFVVSGSLIWYATEGKPYSSDVTMALVLLWVGYECARENTTSGNFRILAIAGVLTQWFSYPTIFILGAIGTGLGINFILTKDWRKLFWLLQALALAVINFILMYFLFLQSVSSESYLVNFWQPYFMPMPPWRNLAWFYQVVVFWIKDPLGFSNIILAIILLALGCVSMFLRNRRLAVYMVLPFLITMLASGFGKYPFAGRLLLFTLPLACILIAEGLQWIHLMLLAISKARFNPLIVYTCSLLIAGLLIATPVSAAFAQFIHPNRGEDITTSMAYIQNHRQPNDKIYVYYGASGPFRYYAGQYDFSDDNYIVGIQSRQDPQKYIADIQNLRGNQRVWFVFSHVCPTCSVDEKKIFIVYLNRIGKKLDALQVSGGAVYLYDLRHQAP